MSRRHQIVMTPEEIEAFLTQARTLILVSNGPRGYPHPMPMWFVREASGEIRMTTYAKSQKIRNLERDPRVTLLAEDGEEYAKLRGVLIYARAELVTEPETVLDTMVRASRTDLAALPASQRPAVEAGLRAQAAKRVVVRCLPERIVSWDHAKLGGVH
jgi:nitroimidazol reductase NimA-like FMN-containing flavoprotein (pyridoxamine 5'-phosphate oxidase superfamily)